MVEKGRMRGLQRGGPGGGPSCAWAPLLMTRQKSLTALTSLDISISTSSPPREQALGMLLTPATPARTNGFGIPIPYRSVSCRSILMCGVAPTAAATPLPGSAYPIVPPLVEYAAVVVAPQLHAECAPGGASATGTTAGQVSPCTILKDGRATANAQSMLHLCTPVRELIERQIHTSAPDIGAAARVITAPKPPNMHDENATGDDAALCSQC